MTRSRLHPRRASLAACAVAPDSPLPHRYGLGLEAYEYGGTTILGHGGGAAGYAVMMFRIASRATTLVTAINAGDLGADAAYVLVPSVDVILGAHGT
jgi:hypothetical protein